MVTKFENIEKVSIFKNKIEKVNNSIEKKEEFKEAYIAIVAMVETALVILLKKVYNEELYTTHISMLSNLLLNHNEKVIADEANYINLNREDEDFMEYIEKEDVFHAIERFDNIIKIILESHGNIFEK